MIFSLDFLLTRQNDLHLDEACLTGSLPRIHQVSGRQAAHRFLFLVLTTF